MKKLFLLFILFVSSFAVRAAECNAQKDPMLEILSNELMRNFKTLKKQKPPVYYLSYQLKIIKELNLIAVAGDLSQNTKGIYGWLDVDARVGSAQTDNTHELKGFWNKYRLAGGRGSYGSKGPACFASFVVESNAESGGTSPRRL